MPCSPARSRSGPKQGDFPGRVSERLIQIEPGAIVLGDRGEVLFEGYVQKLDRVDYFLRLVDQDQDVAEAFDLLEAIDLPDRSPPSFDRPASPGDPRWRED